MHLIEMNSALKPVLSTPSAGPPAASSVPPPHPANNNKPIHSGSNSAPPPPTYGPLVGMAPNVVAHTHLPNPAHQQSHYAAINVPNSVAYNASANNAIPSSNHPVPNSTAQFTSTSQSIPKGELSFNNTAAGYHSTATTTTSSSITTGNHSLQNSVPPVIQTLPATQPMTSQVPPAIKELPVTNGTPMVAATENHVTTTSSVVKAEKAIEKQQSHHEKSHSPESAKNCPVSSSNEKSTATVTTTIHNKNMDNNSAAKKTPPQVVTNNKEPTVVNETTTKSIENHKTTAADTKKDNTTVVDNAVTSPQKKDTNVSNQISPWNSAHKTLVKSSPKSDVPQKEYSAAVAAKSSSFSGVSATKSNSLNESPRNKRARTRTQPYQSPLPEIEIFTKMTSSTPRNRTNHDKLIVFYRNEFLAVRNSDGGFYVCQAMQNIYKTSTKIRIRWLSQDENNSNIFTADFYDTTEFDCILTNLKLERIEKGRHHLPSNEKTRTDSILNRSIAVEKGEMTTSNLTEEHPDGIDVSLYKEENQLKRPKKRKAPPSEQQQTADEEAPQKKRVAKSLRKSKTKKKKTVESTVAAKFAAKKRATKQLVSITKKTCSTSSGSGASGAISSRQERAKRRSGNSTTTNSSTDDKIKAKKVAKKMHQSKNRSSTSKDKNATTNQARRGRPKKSK